MILAFGCSHTAGLFYKNLSWPQLYSGRDKVTVFAEGANSFQQQVAKAQQLNCNRKPWLRWPRAIVLQKTHPCRYPWFCKPEHFIAGEAYKRYYSLPEMVRESLMEQIFEEEKRLLDEFVGFFSRAQKKCLWTYWYDMLCCPDRPSYKYIREFHKYAATKGFDDLWTVVDAELITKEAEQFSMHSKEWFQFLYEQKWICAPDDPHASTEVNKRIADKIREWVEQ